MRIAVTGARSDLATALAAICAARSLSIVPAPPSSELDLLGPVEAWDAWLRGAEPDAVIHLAGSKPPASETVLHTTNVQGTARLVRAMERSAPRARLVIASSSSIYGQTGAGTRISHKQPPRPTNAYGRSKTAQEDVALHWAAQKGGDVVCARIFNVVGAPHDAWSAAPSLFRRIAAAAPDSQFVVQNGSCVRDFVDYRDVAAGLFSLAAAARPERIVNLCTGNGVTVLELAQHIARLLGKRLTFESVDDYDDSVIGWSVGDNAGLTETGWRPAFSLDRSLRDMMSRS